jgi:hypothetical protein
MDAQKFIAKMYSQSNQEQISRAATAVNSTPADSKPLAVALFLKFEVTNMQPAMHLKTTILPGGKIEVNDLNSLVGEWVDVFVLLPHSTATKTRRSALDVLAEAPGQSIFKTVEEVDAYIKEERDSWDR